MGFPGHRLCQKGFSGSRRAYQQSALGQFRADFGVSSRIMKEINYFLQRFLRFIFPGHIFKANAGFLLHIDFSIAFPNAHHSPAAFCHPSEQKAQNQPQKQHRHNIGQYDGYNHPGAIRHNPFYVYIVFQKTLG